MVHTHAPAQCVVMIPSLNNRNEQNPDHIDFGHHHNVMGNVVISKSHEV